MDFYCFYIVSLERLELCPKLQTAVVRGNKIEAVPDLRCCPQLWKIDLANNVVNFVNFMPWGCLKSISSMPAVNKLLLSQSYAVV